MYGKIINGNIDFKQVGTSNIKIGNTLIWGRATEQDLLNCGYIQLMPTENPFLEREGFSTFFTFEIQNGEIICLWHEQEVQNEQLP